MKNRFSAVTDTVRFSHAGRLGASTMLVGWSTVPLNNIGELLLFTSTKYLKVWFPPGGIPVALSIKAVQEMIAVTGVVSSALMTTVRPLGASGGSEKGGVTQSNEVLRWIDYSDNQFTNWLATKQYKSWITYHRQTPQL